MKTKELLKLLRTKRNAYAYVAYSNNDGAYFQIVKSDMIRILEKFAPDYEVEASLQHDEIYIG